jgi:hypothetical protein
MRRHQLRVFQLAAAFQISGDAGRALFGKLAGAAGAERKRRACRLLDAGSHTLGAVTKILTFVDGRLDKTR